MATLDVETAEACFYSLPRGKNDDGSKKFIKGPSIRLAEIALSCYGNLRAASRIVGTNITDDPHVIIQAVCHDLEKNSAISIEKRRTVTKKKFKERPDSDDINLATNACSAIALRDAIFKVVPGVLVKPVYEAAKRVAIGDAKTLNERRDKAIEVFTKMGVTLDRILFALDRKGIEEIDLEDLETLTGLRSAIKDGQTTIESAFPLPQKEAKAGIFGADKSKTETPPPAETKPAAEPPKEPAAKTEKKAEPATPPANALANDKTRLSEWLVQNNLGWGQIQAAVAREFGTWAESAADVTDLTMQQAKVILGAKEEILKAVQP